MDTIKLIISKLGRIRNSEVEITPWMIISGESGLGKSYLSTLVHYFFEILQDPKRLNVFFIEQGIDYNNLIPTFRNSGSAFKIQKEDLEKWLALDAVQYIKYMIKDDSLNADLRVVLPDSIESEIVCSYEEEVSELNNDVETYLKLTLKGLTYRLKNVPQGLWEESHFAFFFRYYLKKWILGDHKALERTFVFPPSRGIMMTEDVSAVTGMYQKFAADKKFLESAKDNPTQTSEDVVQMMRTIMEGRVHIVDGKQYVYTMSDVEMPLSAAASSVRELAPFEMLIDNVNIKNTAILIEEPEAHLHPAKQRLMADLLCLMSMEGVYMQITTHSDFFIRRLNELVKLKILEGTMDEKAFEILKNKMNCVALPNTNTLSAYVLEQQFDGYSQVIRQNIEHGVPYKSFLQPIKESVEFKKLLDSSEE